MPEGRGEDDEEEAYRKDLAVVSSASKTGTLAHTKERAMMVLRPAIVGRRCEVMRCEMMLRPGAESPEVLQRLKM